MPRKSRTRGRATLNRRSRNSHIRSPRRVTLAPMGISSRSLKLATDFLALVMMAFWPVILVRSPTTASSTLEFSRASPQPQLTTILSSLGICMTDL